MNALWNNPCICAAEGFHPNLNSDGSDNMVLPRMLSFLLNAGVLCTSEILALKISEILYVIVACSQTADVRP